MHRRRRIIHVLPDRQRVFLVWVVFWVACGIRPAQSDGAWWDGHARMVYTNSPAAVAGFHGSTQFSTSLVGAFGPYGMKLLGNPEVVNQSHVAGLKHISYFETFGTCQTLIIELGTPSGGQDYTPAIATGSNWDNYHGGTIAWAGPEAWFDNLGFAQPYTRTHPIFGGGPMRYPDGTIATGYVGDPTNPLNHRVYDAACAKDLLGGFTWKEDFYPSDSSQHTGLVFHEGQYYGRLGPGKDSACPHWIEYDAASVRLAASEGLDGIWTDNFSAWNSFGHQPVRDAFGEWSVARFRDYLDETFSSGELASMGISDASVFDIRTYLRSTMTTLGGMDTDLSDPLWLDPSWRDDPVWRAYLIFKRRAGTEALANFYTAVKQAAANTGKPDFLVAGNDIPTISLGWPRGTLDMVNAEYSFGWSLDGGSIGTMLPPKGRQGVRYKLAREHAQSRFIQVWPQFTDSSADGNQHNYAANPNVCRVIFAEMLAHNATPLPGMPNLAGTAETLTNMFGFIEANEAFWGARTPIEQVGLYYSSSSALMQYAPGGTVDLDYQPHQFALYGWGMALDKMHYTYRMLPEWKLTAQTLSQFTVFIVPNAEVLDPADASVLAAWVTGGGRLIVTGDSGHRLGEAGNFAVNPGGFALAPLTGQSSLPGPGFTAEQTIGAGKVVYVRDNIGAEYYVNPARPDSSLPAFQTALASAWTGADAPVIDAQGTPSTVGFTVFRDSNKHRQFVDIYNTNIDLPSDTSTPTGPFTFDVRVSPDLDVPDLTATAISPDGAVTVGLARSGDRTYTVSVSNVITYASVMLAFPDTDGDGLSDATEPMLGTDANLADTDGDGLSDGDEVAWDGIAGIYTPGADTDPLNPDTDGDGVADGMEAIWHSDPLDPASFPSLPLVWWPVLVLLIPATYARRSRTRPS